MGTFKANCEKLGLTTEADELDWILMQSKQAVLFYDSMQVVGPSGIDFERFDKKMEDSFNRRMIAYFTLITQMRVQGGNAYIDQVRICLRVVAVANTYLKNTTSSFIQIFQNLRKICMRKRMKLVYQECWQVMHGRGLVRMTRR